MSGMRSRTSPARAASRNAAASLSELAGPLAFLLLAACAPTLAIQEVRVVPSTVCPCEPIGVEVAAPPPTADVTPAMGCPAP